MKKINGIIITFLFTILFASCGNKKVLQKITIANESNIKNFVVNEPFNIDGLKVNAVYKNSEEEIDKSKLTIHEPDLKTTGTKDVLIEYTSNKKTYSLSYQVCIRSVNLEFTYLDNAYMVTGILDESNLNIKIPREYDDGIHGLHPVTSIEERAFENCYCLSTITIPNTVTTIADYAFENCIGAVIYTEANEKPNGWTDLWNKNEYGSINNTENPVYWNTNSGNYFETLDAIYYISNDEITLTRYIGIDKEFAVPDKLKGKEVKTIGKRAFNSCYSLENISMTNNITEIEQEAFLDCKNMISIKLSESISVINHFCFTGCEKLTSIEIPNNVTRIGEYAFSRCVKLTKVNFKAESKLEEFDNNVFWHCYKLENITIPLSVKKIGAEVFGYCIGFTSFVVHENIEVFGYNTFIWCVHLTTIYIQNEDIASCIRKNDANVAGAITNYANTIYIRDDIEKIGSYIEATYTKASEKEIIDGVSYYKYTR